jgi:glycine betaine/proline transport system permease protein
MPLHLTMENYKLPVGEYIELFFDWLVDNASWLFDAISFALEKLINGSTDALLLLNPIAFMLLVAFFAYRLHRSVSLVVYVILSLLTIWNLGYWEETMQTLSLVL